MPQRQDIERTLLGFLCKEAPPDVDLEVRTDLIGSGVLDSLLIMDVMAFIELSFAVRIQAADVSPRHFGSVAALTELVMSRLPQHCSAA